MATDPQRAQSSAGERMTVEAYFQLDYTYPNAKYEYQEGIVWLMAGGSREHDTIAFNMRTALKQQLRTGPCFVVGSDMRVKVSESSYYFPDVTVSCDVADRRRGNTLIRSPRIVVEVLSPSTEKLDRNEKMKRYQDKATIQEVLLISQFDAYIEVFRRGSGDVMSWDYATYGLGEVVAIDSLDIQISIEEIYEDIDFDEPLVEE